MYESLEDASREKENNDEQTTTVATTSLPTPKTGKINKKNSHKRIIYESDDEEHLAPVFRKKSKSVTTQTQNQEKANISSTMDFTTGFLTL